MSNSRKNSKILSLCMAMVLVWGVFMGLPVSASAMEALSVGTSADEPQSTSNAPGNPHWDGETGTAVWEAVPGNAGTPNDQGYPIYYTWSLYRLESDRLITSVNDFQRQEQVRYGSIFDDSTYSADLVDWIEDKGDGYYYFTVCVGKNDGTNEYSVSEAFHYTKPDAANKLPTPTGLRWEFFEPKWYSVWDNIFADDFINAKGFNVTCYNESGEVYTHLFTRNELMMDRDETGIPGALLYLNKPDGKYQFKVRAVSANPTQYESSDWSELSPWVEVYATTQPPASGNSSNSDSDSSGGSGGGRFGFGSSGAIARNPVVQTAGTIKNLAAAAQSKGETVAQSQGTREVTVKGSAWSLLEGLTFQHDTVANGAVQVRVTINNPAALLQDMKVSAYATGRKAERIGNLFDKHFSNKTGVVYFDQTGPWGQEVQIAAKLNLTGMNTDNLVLYTFDRTANAYSQLPNPQYSIDANGYLHFSTPYAGAIVVSDGALSEK